MLCSNHWNFTAKIILLFCDHLNGTHTLRIGWNLRGGGRLSDNSRASVKEIIVFNFSRVSSRIAWLLWKSSSNTWKIILYFTPLGITRRPNAQMSYIRNQRRDRFSVRWIDANDKYMYHMVSLMTPVSF